MRYTHEFMGTSYCRQFNLLLGRNACLGYMRVSQMFFFYAVHSRIYGYELLPSIQPSSRTKRMFGIHTCLSNVFFYAVHSRIYGYELLPSLVSARKVTFGSTVSCKWTRQLPYLNSINSSFSLNKGIFRNSITCMASLWRRNTTDKPTLHRISNVCCVVARRRKILSEV